MTIIKIFISPSIVFQTLVKRKNRKDSTAPLVILAVAGLMSMFLLQDLLKDYQREQSIQRIEESSHIPEDQKDELISDIYNRIENPSTLMQVVGWASSATSTPIRVMFMSLIVLFVGNFIFGGKSTYGAMLTITAYSYLVNIPELIVKIPLMLSKWSMEVYTGLGIFEIGEQGSFVNMFLAGIDIFAIWRLVLIAIGMSIVYQKGTKPIFITLISFWLLLLAFGVGVASLLS
ncbi:MAG: YIP1 family protein [Candidatus Marinimicrobia bacterium]|nr:YIP1 family protein [Candidatus Neomarinimicrobiota bacterium]